MARHSRLWAFPVLALSALLGAAPLRAADAKYLPPDTELVLTINFKQILDSDLVKAQKQAIDIAKGALEQALPGEDQALKYLKSADFDLFRDLVSVTFALPATKRPEDGVVLIEGKFNAEKFYAAAEDAAKEHGDVVKITRAGALRIIEVTPPGEKKAYVSLIGKNVLVAASNKEKLQGVATAAAEGKGPKHKEAFANLLKTTSAKQSFSFVATGPALAKLLENNPDVPNAEAVGPVLRQLQGVSGALTISKDIQFQLGIGTQDAETAKKLSQGANIGLFTVRALVNQKVMEDPKLAPVNDIMKTLRVSAQGTSLVISGNASVTAIEALIKNFVPNQP
jgi:hypothetical protein